MPGPKMNRELTHERLLEVLDYDPATGMFVWKKMLSRKFPVGRKAGGLRNGKLYIRIDEQDYTAARLAWFYVNGQWPVRLRFADEDVTNVRIANLAETNALDGEYDHTTREGRVAYMKDHHKRHPQMRRDAALKNNFGIDLAAYQAMHDAQDGRCAICHKLETLTRRGNLVSLAVDHNHETGVIRGLLCHNCNTLIGHAREDETTLQAAIDYLRKHNEVPLEPAFSPYHTEFLLH